MSDYRLNFDTDYDMDQERPEGIEDLTLQWREYVQHREIISDAHRDIHAVYKQLSEDLTEASGRQCRKIHFWWFVLLVIIVTLRHI